MAVNIKKVGNIIEEGEKSQIKWIVEDFNTSEFKNVEDMLQSPIFKIKGIEWFLELYPNGDTIENEGYVGAFLAKKYSHQQNIRCNFTISILTEDDEICISDEVNNIIYNSEMNAWGFPKLINLEKLHADILSFNNKLKILCDITVKIDTQTENEEFNGEQTLSPCNSNSLNFEAFFNNKHLCDITFIIGDNKIYSHKILLANKSEAFKRIFLRNNGRTTNVIEIKDIDYQTFKETLRFIYTGQVRDLKTMTEKLLKSAEKFEITDLKTLCEKNLCYDVTIENAIEYMSLADQYKLTTLKKKVMDFVVTNIDDIVDVPEFEKIENIDPYLVKELFRTVVTAKRRRIE